MSQENMQLAYRASDAVNRRDLGAYLALMDGDVEAVPRVGVVEGDFHGHDKIRRWWGNLFDVFPDFTVEVVQMRDPGDLILAALLLRGRGAGGDAPVEESVWYVAQWRRGKCTWWGTFQTRAQALEAVGLRG